MTTLRIGTRRSTLALAQADEVRTLLAATGVEAELVPMTTSGDEGAPIDDSPTGLKGLFIDTILESLGSGAIDLAVHSAKDLPAEEDDGFSIAAVPERLPVLDVIVTREPTLPVGARVGTSSPRRRAQLLRTMPGIEVVPLRGNVDTRLRKVADGEVDGAVLAAAGLRRLAIRPDHLLPLEVEEMVPPPGQGALALQVRSDDPETAELLRAIDHRESHVALEAERSLMWRLGGGCALPMGAYATVDGATVRMLAVVTSLDGAREARAVVESDSAEGAASAAAKRLLAQGAERILAEVLGE